MIGPGGRIINQIKEQSKVSAIDMDEEGNVEVTAGTLEAAQTAADYISLIVEDPMPGKVFRCVSRDSNVPLSVTIMLPHVQVQTCDQYSNVRCVCRAGTRTRG